MSMETTVLLICTIICFIVEIISLTVGFYATYHGNRKARNICGWVTGIVMIASVYFAASVIHSLVTDTAEECIRNGYEVYVNGEEADVTKLDLDIYHISIDSELQEIYLTPQ